MTLFSTEPPPRRVRCGAGCGHWLTDPKSIARKLGLKCARDLGLIPPAGPRIPTRPSTAEPIPLEDPMICPPCSFAADIGLGPHEPTVCRDHAIPGHGCTCQHGAPRPHGPAPTSTPETPHG